MHGEPRPSIDPGPDLESTTVLLERARQGDASAREQLARRYLPRLRSFAHGRLPATARGMEETDDIVQVAMVRGFAHLETFRAERQGSFLVYLRVVVYNLIRDRWRSGARKRASDAPPEDLPDLDRTPLECAVAREERERYERALSRLRPGQREAIVLRFELDCDYAQVAEELGIGTANGARMRVERALVRLAELLKEQESPA